MALSRVALADRSLDELTALAARALGVPIALIVLVDEQRQWFAAVTGLSAPEPPREGSFTEHVIARRDVLVVPDTARDRRFAAHPFVAGEPHVRFYAGAPLITPGGEVLGALAIMDHRPRRLSPSQREILVGLSRQALALLEGRRRTLESADGERLLRIVTDNARVGLVVIDAERRYVHANRMYAEILGLPPTALVGRRVEDVLPDVYRDQIAPRLDLGFSGERVAYDLRRQTPEGERVYSVRYEPAETGGAVTLVAVVITEVTEHRRASDRLAAIVESSADAIIGKDLEGIITSWNGGAEALFGYTAAEMVGRPILRLIPPDRHHEEQDILDRIRRNESVAHFETVRRTKDGRLIDVSITASPIRDASGRVVGASKVARDISERRRAERESRFQQAMLATERELTLDGILTVDGQSRVLSFNRRFAEMWGITDALIASRADTVLLGSVRDKLKDPDGFMERVRQLYDRHDEVSEDEVELTDGRIFERHSAPMHDADGRYYGRVWYFRDATDRRRAESALRQERDRAERYLDTVDVIVLALDLEGRVTLINRKGCDLLGWTEAELLGRRWVDTCVPARIRRSLTDTFERLLEGDVSLVENPVLTRSGEERLIEWRNRVLRDADDHVVGTLSSGADITERHRAIEALRTAEERMRFALESAEIGIWDMDYTTGRLQWSAILEAQYGLPAGTFPGTFEAFLERVYPEDRTPVQETVGRAMKSGADFTILNRAVWPDGTVRWLTGAGRILVDEHGTPVRGVGISQDVTDRRSLEQQYQQAQKMEAVGRLAGGIAHDFNNLLTTILGYCDLLLAGRDAADQEYADVREIQHAGARAAALTRQLLAFSRKQIIEPTLLDLNAIIDDMRAMLERLIGEDIAVALNLERPLAPVRADRGQVEQVVMNLAVNARDAMPHGGTLTIGTASVELDDDYVRTHISATPGPYVVLTVTDSGTGMSPDVQARMFEPFFTTKEVGKGTGLGLATVHGIVTRSGGTVGVYSELGHGTTFRVYFPRTEAADAVLEPAAPPRVQGGTETVLVVEDAEGLRDLAKRLLERQGYTVLVAANADEALRLFEQHASIDVLLTDVVMPGTSGPELTRQLVERWPGLKVVYMSGYTEEAISHHGVLEPGIVFLQKPFTSDTLARKIRGALDRTA